MSEKIIKIKNNNKEINEKLNELAKRAKNLKPALREIGHIMQHYVSENFETEGRQSGEKWADWKDSYKDYRKKINKGNGQILQLFGELKESIDYKTSNDEVILGTDKDYARIHNEGGFVRKRGGKGLFEMPKREYMKWTPELEELVADELYIHLKLQDYIDEENARIKFLKGE